MRISTPCSARPSVSRPRSSASATPVVAMVGELPDPARVAGSGFVNESDAIGLIGPFEPNLAGSELAKQRGQLDMGLPQPEIDSVAAACQVIRDAVRAGKLSSVHDASDGGIAVALAESAIAGGIGCRVDLQHLRERGCTPEEALFGEGPGGFLVSGEPEVRRFRLVDGGHNWALWRGNAADAYLAASKHLVPNAA